MPPILNFCFVQVLHNDGKFLLFIAVKLPTLGAVVTTINTIR